MDSIDLDAAPTLLIVDDSSADRHAFRRFLTRDGDALYQIEEAESGETGLALLSKSIFDLILLDYRLPDMDGLEFLQAMSMLPQHSSVPVIMLTGQGDERLAVASMKAGACDYIVKQQLGSDSLKLAVRAGLRDAALQARVENYQAQQSLLYDVALRMRQSLNIQDILEQAVLEVRQILTCDRAIIYRFLPNYTGFVAVESVQSPWPSLLGKAIEDSCFKNGWVDNYLNGQTTSIRDIHNSGLMPCHVQLLERCQVKSNLVVPIIIATSAPIDGFVASHNRDNALGKDDQETVDKNRAVNDPKMLWGLLIAHQCETPRQWKASETRLLEQLSIQLAIAIQQADLYEQLQSANQQLEAKVEARTQELQRLNQSLLESNQDLEQFAYIASHDLREPLRKVKSFAELLSKRYSGELDETADRYINYITGGAVRMQTLINDLLTYARLGKQSLTQKPSDLNDVISRVLQTLEAQIAHRKAVVQVDTLPTIAVDALQIEQLLLNLIENGLKYNDKPTPEITVFAEQADEFWKICVKDNGIGIDAQFYDRIFTIFQRLHAKGAYSGTGIGLAICKKIAERHGGSVHVKSSPEKGSTFCVALPYSDPQKIVTSR